MSLQITPEAVTSLDAAFAGADLAERLRLVAAFGGLVCVIELGGAWTTPTGEGL